jgi:hypothetical protein
MTDREIAKVHARVVARSWANNTDDKSRIVLEQAGEAMRFVRGEINALREMVLDRDARLVRQALHLERAELEAEAMRRAAFGGQKGGSA